MIGHWKGLPTRKRLHLTAKPVVEELGADWKCQDIRLHDIDDLVALWRERRENKGGTLNRKLAGISKVLGYWSERSQLPKVKMPRFKEADARGRFLSAEEERAVIDTFRARDRLDCVDWFVLSIATGARPSELRRVLGRDNTGDRIHLWHTKTGKPHSVPMTPRVRELVERRGCAGKLGHKAFGWMDPSEYRHQWDWVREYLGYEDDPNFVPYICRHTFASRLVQAGVDLRVVIELMGHATFQMTLRYAALAPRNMDSAIEALVKASAA